MSAPAHAPAPACAPLDGASLLGSFQQYRTDLAPCTPTAARQIGKPLFFGRHPAKNEPIFVAMDFEQYEIARKGMAVATTAALVLGAALVVVLIKNKKGGRALY